MIALFQSIIKGKKIVQSEIDPLTLQPKGVKIKQG